MLSSRMSTLPLMRGMHLAAGGAATSAGRVSTSVVPATTVPLEGLIRSRHAAWQWTNTCSPQVGRRNFRHGRPVGQENSMEAVFAVSEDALQGATEKQRRYAETVAAKRGMQVPEHALSSREACSAFIDMLLASPADDAEVLETLAPTERQLQYARQLAKEYGMELSSEAVANRRACSEFIDRVPPSQKQVAFAKLLAERRGVPIPPHVLTQRKACSDFIDENKQESLSSTAARLPWAASPAMGPGPQPPVASSPRADFDVDLTDLIHRLAAAATPTRPSLYQLLTGVYMAQERGLALPQQALQDMRAMSNFVEATARLPPISASTPSPSTSSQDPLSGKGGKDDGFVRVLEVQGHSSMEDFEGQTLEVVLLLCAEDAEGKAAGAASANASEVQSYLAEHFDVHADLLMVQEWLNSLVDRGLLLSTEDGDLFWPPQLQDDMPHPE